MAKIRVKYNVSERRDNVITFMATDKQKEWLDNRAQSLGLSRSAVISELVNKEIDNDEDS